MRRSGKYDELFRRVFNAHYDAVARYCVRRLPREDVDDAVAQVFVVAWRKVEQMPEEDATLLWLYRISHYEVSTMRRSARRRDDLHSKVAGLARPVARSAESAVTQHSEHEAVMTALDTLSGPDREVIFLRSYEELPIADIASVLDCSRDAAAKRLSRAHERLRRAVDIPDAVLAAPQPGPGPKAGET